MADDKDAPTPRKAFGSAAKPAPDPAPTSKPVPENTQPANEPTIPATTTPVRQVAEARDKAAVEQLSNPNPDPARETQRVQTDGTSVPANAEVLNPQPPQAPKPEPEKKDEGTYVDPNSLPPNPNAELTPGTRQPVSDFPYRGDLVQVNDHQVHPELYFGTTPTDPDIRHREDHKEVTTEQQQAEMVRRRSSAFEEETVPLGEPNKEVDALRRRMSEAPRPASPERPRITNTPISVKANGQYKIRHEGATAWWWKRKYDTFPVVTVEGTVKDVFGTEAGDRAMAGHYLVGQLNNRIGLLPANNPILKNHDKELYVVNVMGHREIAHAAELESVDEPQPAA